ncbi:MAG TPA: hypothetical protein VH170_00010 [Chthoniobacterales bacterium]|jgi:hypothetical protein|nr:hypothetical protein [Chthoniobacterales bacterium]
MKLISIFLMAFAATALAQWQVVTVNRVTLEGALKDGGAFEVRVDSDAPKEAAGEFFGATDAPRAVVSGIIVKGPGGRIAFPKNAFTDLANPLLQTVSITSQGSSNLKLRFTGGEGAANYEVEYFIEGNKLVRRNVSYFDRGGKEKGRVIKTMNFGAAGEATEQP